MRWFFYSDGETLLRGSNELRRYSKVIQRQRFFTIFGHRVFYGTPEVELEVIERWAMSDRSKQF